MKFEYVCQICYFHPKGSYYAKKNIVICSNRQQKTLHWISKGLKDSVLGKKIEILSKLGRLQVEPTNQNLATSTDV